MGGLLHNVIEDRGYTAPDLFEMGVPDVVVHAVVSVSKVALESYDEFIGGAAPDPLGRLVKLADNAHNLASNDLLAATDPEAATRLWVKYETVRQRLLDAHE